MIRACVMLAVVMTMAACTLFPKPQPKVTHDPVRTLCAAIGQMTWRQADTEKTKENIKVHNAIRRTLCPPDRYPEWYYGEAATAAL